MPQLTSAANTARRILPAMLVALVLCCTVWAYPEPAAVPYRWELEFEPGELRLFYDPIDGSSYWHFTYVVTNRTGSDQIWAPTFVLFTDVGEILVSGDGVPSRIEENLRALLGNELLETQNEIIGDIHQGREHAKDGLAVWPARNIAVNELSLFVAGISGETARVLNPITSKEVILRKTLQRDYIIRGDAYLRGSRPVEIVGDRWILR